MARNLHEKHHLLPSSGQMLTVLYCWMGFLHHVLQMLKTISPLFLNSLKHVLTKNINWP